jgi:sugar phosphate isomerase/epimerase
LVRYPSAARIVKLHLKDFQLDRQNGRFTWRNIGEGDLDRLAVHRAITDVGFRGYVRWKSQAAMPRI